MDYPNSRVPDLVEKICGVIGATIIHQDHFIGTAHPVQSDVQSAEERRQILAFVEQWNNDGDVRWVFLEAVHVYFGMFLRPTKTKE